MQANMEPQITITRTGDISDTALAQIQNAAASVGLDVKSELHGFKAAEGPTYIQVLAELLTWKTILGITVTAFLAKFAQKAAEDTYDLFKATTKYLATEAAQRLRTIASAVFKASKEGNPKTYIAVGFPKPNTFFGTTWRFKAENEEEVALNMAGFALKAEAINEALETVVLKYGKPATGVFLEVNKDGSVILKWHDPKTLEPKQYTID